MRTGGGEVSTISSDGEALRCGRGGGQAEEKAELGWVWVGPPAARSRRGEVGGWLRSLGRGLGGYWVEALSDLSPSGREELGVGLDLMEAGVIGGSHEEGWRWSRGWVRQATGVGEVAGGGGQAGDLVAAGWRRDLLQRWEMEDSGDEVLSVARGRRPWAEMHGGGVLGARRSSQAVDHWLRGLVVGV